MHQPRCIEQSEPGLAPDPATRQAVEFGIDAGEKTLSRLGVAVPCLARHALKLHQLRRNNLHGRRAADGAPLLRSQDDGLFLLHSANRLPLNGDLDTEIGVFVCHHPGIVDVVTLFVDVRDHEVRGGWFGGGLLGSTWVDRNEPAREQSDGESNSFISGDGHIPPG